jgi:hypothetical protein
MLGRWSLLSAGPSEVVYLKRPFPLLVEVFTDEATMTVVRRSFGAEKACTIECRWGEFILNLTLRH